MPRGRRGQATGALALAAVILYAGAQAAAIVHRASVAHVVCVEHGELEHLERSAAPSLVVDSREPALRAGATGAAEHEHEHCSAAVSSRAPATVAVDLVLPSSAADPGQDPRLAPQRTSRRLRLLLAPKSSPPATRPLA